MKNFTKYTEKESINIILRKLRDQAKENRFYLFNDFSFNNDHLGIGSSNTIRNLILLMYEDNKIFFTKDNDFLKKYSLPKRRQTCKGYMVAFNSVDKLGELIELEEHQKNKTATKKVIVINGVEKKVYILPHLKNLLKHVNETEDCYYFSQEEINSMKYSNFFIKLGLIKAIKNKKLPYYIDYDVIVNCFLDNVLKDEE